MEILKQYLEKLGINKYSSETNFRIEKTKYFYSNIDSEIAEELKSFLVENLPNNLVENIEINILDCIYESKLIWIFFAKMYFICELYNEKPLKTVKDANDYVKHYLKNKDNQFLDEFKYEREFQLLNFIKNNENLYQDKEIINKYNELFNKMYLTSIFYNLSEKVKCDNCEREVSFYQLSGYNNDTCDLCD